MFLFSDDQKKGFFSVSDFLWNKDEEVKIAVYCGTESASIVL